MASESNKEHHDNEGKTPAAWTTVILLIIASCVGGVAVVLGNWWLFGIGGGGLTVLALIVGKIMAAAGLGAKHPEATEPAEVSEATAA